MKKAAYNRFCKSLEHATHVVQWGGSDVWKIGGKVFAIGGEQDDGAFGITFKVSPIAFEFLKDQRLPSRAVSGVARHEVDSALHGRRSERRGA